MSARVGIIVRTGPGSALTARAVDTVRRQTHGDWALVLVGDPDDPVPVVEDDRIQRLDGSGMAPAERVNAALASLDAEFAVVLDDAVWHPEFLSQTVAHLLNHPNAVGVASRAERVLETIDATGIHEVSREMIARDVDDVSLVELSVRNYVPAASLVFRVTAGQEVGDYDVSLSSFHEWDFLLRLLSIGPVDLLDGEPLAEWHSRADSNVASSRDVAVRDRYLRQDIAQHGEAPAGLGLQLAIAHQLRSIGDQSDAARAEMARVVDRWGHGHQAQLDATSTQLRIEVGRLRGEMLLMRETVASMEEHMDRLSDQLDRSLKRTNRNVNQALRALNSPPPPSDPPKPVGSRARDGVRRVVRRVRRTSRSSAPSAD